MGIRDYDEHDLVRSYIVVAFCLIFAFSALLDAAPLVLL